MEPLKMQPMISKKIIVRDIGCERVTYGSGR